MIFCFPITLYWYECIIVFFVNWKWSVSIHLAYQTSTNHIQRNTLFKFQKEKSIKMKLFSAIAANSKQTLKTVSIPAEHYEASLNALCNTCHSVQQRCLNRNGEWRVESESGGEWRKESVKLNIPFQFENYAFSYIQLAIKAMPVYSVAFRVLTTVPNVQLKKKDESGKNTSTEEPLWTKLNSNIH